MANLSLVIVPAKALKDGSHKIRVAVSHNGETRYIITDLRINSAKEFKNGQVIKRNDASFMNTKLRSILAEYQKIIYQIETINCLTCSELVFHIQHVHDKDNRTVHSVFEEYINLSQIKGSSANSYRTSYNTLAKFMNTKLLIQNVNHSTVLAYNKYLLQQHYSPGTIRNKMALLMILLSYAKKCQYAEYKINPFTGIQLPKVPVRDAWLSVDDIKNIRDAVITKKNILRCRDIFMLSYYLGGINIIDLVNIDFREPIVSYVRRKTEGYYKVNEKVIFNMPNEAVEIAQKYMGNNGRIQFIKNQYYKNINAFFTRNMPKLAKKINLNEKLIYYSARKSFSQHAFELGVQNSIIDYILGHKLDTQGSCLFNYISVTPEMATQAIRKVLDNLK